MALCQSKRRYVKRRSYNKSSCWRNPITAFFLTFLVLASLRLRVPARSKQAASSLLTKSREWQKQRRREKIRKELQKSNMNSDEIQYQMQSEGSTSNIQRYIAVNKNGERITTNTWARAIAEDDSNASTLIEVIRNCGFSAVFLEAPPVKASTIASQPFEFVLLDAPSLYQKANGNPDINTFEAYFNKHEAATVFDNLGGDAVLISPNPILDKSTKTDVSTTNASFSHLASFVRYAPESIVKETFRTMAQAYLDRVDLRKDEPVWLSTDGRGVNWLHLRLDDKPKYYKYAAYRSI